MTTPRQAACLAFIVGYIERTGASPSLKEIGGALGLSDPGVHRLTSKMIAQGLLIKTEGRHRSLRPVPPATCPACGVKL